MHAQRAPTNHHANPPVAHISRPRAPLVEAASVRLISVQSHACVGVDRREEEEQRQLPPVAHLLNHIFPRARVAHGRVIEAIPTRDVARRFRPLRAAPEREVMLAVVRDETVQPVRRTGRLSTPLLRLNKKHASANRVRAGSNSAHALHDRRGD